MSFLALQQNSDFTTQDMEDFQQDFFLATFKRNFTSEQMASKQKLFLKARKKSLKKKSSRQEAYDDCNFGFESRPDKDVDIFNVLIKADLLPSAQRRTILTFLRFGDLLEVAAQTGENYNTVKANFRHAIKNLKTLIGE